MINRSYTFKLNKKQLNYIITKTGIEESSKAIEYIFNVMNEEWIVPEDMVFFLDELMKLDGYDDK